MTTTPTRKAADFPPPPRRSEWAGRKAALAVWLPRAVLFPHMLIAAGSLVAMMGSLCWLLLGSTVEADVLKTWTSTAKRNTVCHLQWEYLRGGQRFTGDDLYSCDQRDAISRPHVTVPVRALHVGELSYAALWPPVRSPGEMIMFPWIFGGIFNALAWMFGWLLYVVPARQRRLVEDGRATDGTITHKYTRQGKTTMYWIAYSYHPMGSAPQTGKALVSDRARWEAAQEGARIVVLFSVDQPARSVAYEYCPFRVPGNL